MGAIGIIILWSLMLGLIYYVATEFDKIAVMKGHPKGRYFWWCFFTSVIGWLMVVALPDRASEQRE